MVNPLIQLLVMFLLVVGVYFIIGYSFLLLWTFVVDKKWQNKNDAPKSGFAKQKY